MSKLVQRTKKLIIAVTGSLVVCVGVLMIPYPGPGWLVVFIGLGILATEFEWAQRLLDYTKGKYDAWEEWLKRQSRSVQIVFFLVTAIVVVLTLWLINAYGIINQVLGLNWDWLKSPLF